MGGKTLWMKDSPLISIWVWRRCYEQFSFLDDDIIELGLVLRDCAKPSSFSLSPPTMIVHLINEAYELWSHPRVVYSISTKMMHLILYIIMDSVPHERLGCESLYIV